MTSHRCHLPFKIYTLWYKSILTCVVKLDELLCALSTETLGPTLGPCSNHDANTFSFFLLPTLLFFLSLFSSFFFLPFFLHEKRKESKKRLKKRNLHINKTENGHLKNGKSEGQAY